MLHRSCILRLLCYTKWWAVTFLTIFKKWIISKTQKLNFFFWLLFLYFSPSAFPLFHRPCPLAPPASHSSVWPINPITSPPRLYLRNVIIHTAGDVVRRERSRPAATGAVTTHWSCCLRKNKGGKNSDDQSTFWVKQMFTVVWASASCWPLRWIKYSTWKQHQRDIRLPLRNQGLISKEAFLNLQITCLQTLITCAVAKDGQNCRTSHVDSLFEGCVRPADDCIPERLTTFGLTV